MFAFEYLNGNVQKTFSRIFLENVSLKLRKGVKGRVTNLEICTEIIMEVAKKF